MAVPITISNISSQWCTSFFAIIFNTNEPCTTYFTIDGSDPTTSLTKLLYTSPFIIDIEGIITVKYYSISISSSQSNSVQTESIKIDSVAPTSNIITNILPDGENGWYISLPIITITSNDSVSTVDKTFYSWNGTTFIEYLGGALTIPSEGIHYLQVYSIDKASNKENVQTSIFKYDINKPFTSIIVPLEVTHEVTTISFVTSDKASGVQKTYYTIDGSTPTIDSKFGSSFEIKESGLYVVKYFSVDSAGNTESIKESIPFRIEIEKSSLQLLMTESFPINGKNGWYKSYPQIGLLTSKPDTITELKYKIVPKDKPTTATYTGTIEINGIIDLSNGSFIALQIDKSDPLIINVRGVDSTKTVIQDIIDAINNTYTEEIAKETGSNGLSGRGYITVTSPTAGTGSENSEIAFVDPGTFDATEKVFGLNIDQYPHVFTETYLYVPYTNPFVIPGDGVWEVAATTSTKDETVSIKKNYSVDALAPVTSIIINPDHGNDFYTTSPNITFTSLDIASGVDKIIYQFDKGPTLEYHEEDGPIVLPDNSKIIRLIYFSVDLSGNIESPKEKLFNFDDIKPETITDSSTINTYNQNNIDILFSIAKVVNYTETGYDFSQLTPSLQQNLRNFSNWNDLLIYLNALNLDSSVKTFTVNTLSNHVITNIQHNLNTGDVIQFSSTIMLPNPLLSNRYYYVIRFSSTEILVSDTYNDALANIPLVITNVGSGVHSINRAVPEVILFNSFKVFLKAIDDRQYQILNETITDKNEIINELTVENEFLYSISRIYNQTTSTLLTYSYFSKNKIYTNETFVENDVIVVDYIYTGIKHTYYGVNEIPSILSNDDNIVSLQDNGQFTIKYFSIDSAGNEESIKTFPATITILNRAPEISVDIVNSSTLLPYFPNGENSWYKLDSNISIRPAIKINVVNPEIYVFNEDSTLISTSGSGPYNVQLNVLKIDVLKETLSSVINIKNITKNEIYTVNSFSGNSISATCTILPNNSDVFQVDYTYYTLLDYSANSNSKVIKIGDIDNPDIDFDFSNKINPFIFPELPATYNIQGEKDITVIVTNKRDKTTICENIPQLQFGLNTLKLDTYAPISSDTAVTGWVNHDVTVTLNSNDFDLLPVNQDSSGINRILYSLDGVDPNITVFNGTYNLVISTSGNTVIKYRGIDNAGNIEEIKQSVIVQVDKNAPITSVIVPNPDGQNGWYITAPIIELNAVDIDSGIQYVFYKWDNSTFFNLYGGSILIPSEGIHTLYFYSKDNVGNTEQLKTHIFKLDTYKPITSDNIQSGWTNNKIVQFSIASDISGFSKTYYTYTIDPLLPLDPTVDSAFTIDGKVTFSNSGVYNLKYFSVDKAGNFEVVKTASNKFMLDLEKPQVSSIDPSNLIFTSQTHLTINFIDALSGIDIDTVKIVVDDIEYSTSKNSSFFSYTGVLQNIEVKIGPILDIPNFDNLETLVVYANDMAGNSLVPVSVTIVEPDVYAPSIKGFWPKHKAVDVSRNSNVMFFIDDDASGVDLRTVKVKIANTDYSLNMTDVMSIVYTGQFEALITIKNNYMYVIVGGIVVASANFTSNEYSTIKKISMFLLSIDGFVVEILNKNYDQISSLDFISLNRLQVNSMKKLSVALFENNKNISYIPRNNGYLITVTPNETFEDNYVVNVSIDASDFSDHLMVTENFYFMCKEVATQSRGEKNKWFNYHTDIIKRILSNLESTYNSKTKSTVFYGYFKSLALEISRSMQIADSYRSNNYYDNTSAELLYQNLGYLLKYEPKSSYSHDRYRFVLLTLMQMFFKGSTKESITDGLSLLLGVESISIKEYLDNIAWQFMFSFDVEVGSEPIKDWDVFNSEINEVLSLVQPAHTYFLLRYIFSEVIKTKEIIDELVKWHFLYNGTEDVRTDCANKYKKAEIIVENVSSQFDGSNNCCYSYYKPILSIDETRITSNPLDIEVQVFPAGSPISVISVNGFTGKICFDRNPLITEVVKIIYKFNKYIIYRELNFYLNTYTITSGTFDPTKYSLLNQINVPSTSIISYISPEKMHAHICESKIFINIDYGIIREKRFRGTEERLIVDLSDFKAESVDFNIEEVIKWKALLKDKFDLPVEQINSEYVQPYIEQLYSITSEHGFASETNAHPFTTNDILSKTNDYMSALYYLIKRVFGE